MHTYLGESLSLWFLSLITAQADKDKKMNQFLNVLFMHLTQFRVKFRVFLEPYFCSGLGSFWVSFIGLNGGSRKIGKNQ